MPSSGVNGKRDARPAHGSLDFLSLVVTNLVGLSTLWTGDSRSATGPGRVRGLLLFREALRSHRFLPTSWSFGWDDTGNLRRVR